MFDFVEPRVRRVVAEYLGVGVEELSDETSLTDDLAADSLDLVELTPGPIYFGDDRDTARFMRLSEAAIELG